MRSSSIKTLVATVTLVTALSAVAPAASARPVKTPTDGPSTIGSIEESRDRVYRALKRLIRRYFGPSTFVEVAPPLPAPTSETRPQ